jgi:hypothetical protein
MSTVKDTTLTPFSQLKLFYFKHRHAGLDFQKETALAISF